MTAGGSYSATYDYTYDVYRMLMRGMRERSGWWMWKRILACEVLLLLMVVVVVALEKPPAKLGQMLSSSDGFVLLAGAILAVALFVILLDFVFDRFLHRLVFKRYSVANEPVTVQLSDGGVNCRREGIVSSVAWSAIKEATVLLDRAACILWFGKREGVVIPRTAFASEREFEAACEFMKGKVGVS